MAPRKRLLLDDPPSASSSDDSFEEEEEEQQPSTPISNPKHAAAESETGSESDPEPTPALKPKLKSLSSKPMQAKSGTKRSKKQKKTFVSNDDENDDNEEDVKLTGESSKKRSTRVFSEKDDIVILQKLAIFISFNGNDPMEKVKEFHNFVKKSLSIEVNYEQMKRKIRTLKEKYIRDKYKGKDTEHFISEMKIFELSKKIWENIGANEAEENGKVPMAAKEDATGSIQKEAAISHENLVLSEMFRFGDAASLSHCLKKGFELVEESKRQSMEDEWRQIKMEEMELFGQRAALLNHRAYLILQAFNKSSQ